MTSIVTLPLLVALQGNAAGVFIDGAVYTLAGEPPPAKPGDWWRKTSN